MKRVEHTCERVMALWMRTPAMYPKNVLQLENGEEYNDRRPKLSRASEQRRDQ
jgi:hypothetical protein